MQGGEKGRDIFQNRTTWHVGRCVSRLPSGPGGLHMTRRCSHVIPEPWCKGWQDSRDCQLTLKIS